MKKTMMKCLFYGVLPLFSMSLFAPLAECLVFENCVVKASVLAIFLQDNDSMDRSIHLKNVVLVVDQEKFVLKNAGLLIEGECLIHCLDDEKFATFACGTNGFVSFIPGSQLAISDTITFKYALREARLCLHKNISCVAATVDQPKVDEQTGIASESASLNDHLSPTDTYKRLELKDNVFYVSAMHNAFYVSNEPFAIGA